MPTSMSTGNASCMTMTMGGVVGCMTMVNGSTVMTGSTAVSSATSTASAKSSSTSTSGAAGKNAKPDVGLLGAALCAGVVGLVASW